MLLADLSGSAGMEVAALYHVLIPYCVLKLRATSKWKTLHECPFLYSLTGSLVPVGKKNVLQASQSSVSGLGSADRGFCV